ncbi:hypothetical protein TGME49_309780 [Toxoplasma gondii ME49]|uniref:Rrp15p n=3 Tax=Toxoplasma gondii TaxID=5811 RepID=A0A125YX22_TOXGV|nr:hypothetical protein TGME49_309780 [Toxoplasma gondii ME49]EPT26261.1 hypothetical protein TGME49_309780 [Toxoplasma gondii ME49]ESS34789.1 Rrp15p [Toxoplasma gondii VEG]KYF47496.1 Rrp15p [Toxoplasma gondii ARI]CEL77280.1 TPA: Rrp15p domain-containing protein [Toxoplasma gondii VEG]|eukprot:XP_018635607.1 hypothetical protein TGME49_309780 [Toxoplasma gondii ME49]
MEPKRKTPLPSSSKGDREAECRDDVECDSGSETGALSPDASFLSFFEKRKRRKCGSGDGAEVGTDSESYQAAEASASDAETTRKKAAKRREPQAASKETSDLSKAFQDIMSRSLPQPASPSESRQRSSSKQRAKSDACSSASAASPETVPVLAGRPGIFEQLKKEKEEERLRRRLLAARRKQREASHVKPCAADREFEKSLRKIASKGVVRFFNVLMKFRREQAERESDEAQLKRQRKRDAFTRRQKGRNMNQGDTRKTQNFMKMLKSEE